jgi:hypothetical protein
MSNENDPEPRRKNWRGIALSVSVLVHVAIALTLLFIYLPNPDSQRVAGHRADQASGGEDSNARPADRKPPVPEPAEVTNLPAEQLAQSIEAQLDQASRLNDEEKLSELEKNLRRLEKVSDAESVQEITSTIANTIGLDSEAYAADKQAAEGDFDFDSAQLDDVTRRRGDDGQWEYQSILVDKQGRKMTVPMDAGQGETMFSTFEKMKQYPFAQAIYRGIVMPMLQSLIETEKSKRTAEPGDDSFSSESVLPESNRSFGGGKM